MARRKKEAAQQVTTITALHTLLNKKFGEGTALLGSEAADLRLNYFSTGSFALDVCLRGGFADNRIHEVIGAESCTKTSLMHSTSKEFLLNHPNGIVAHGDIENALDFTWMLRLGCDLNRFLFLYPDSGEQAGDVFDETVSQADVPILLIADSVPAMVPLGELTSPTDQDFVGQQARLLNRIIRVANSRLKRSKIGLAAPTTLILINQTRDQIGATQYNQEPGYSSGGQGRKFFSGTRTVLTSSTPKELKSTREASAKSKHMTRHGKRIAFNIIKNKCGGPEETGHYVFSNKPIDGAPLGIDNGEAVVQNGLLYEVLTKKGNYVYHGRKSLGNCTDNAAKFCNNPVHAEHVAELKEEIMSAAREDFLGYPTLEEAIKEARPSAPKASTAKKKATAKRSKKTTSKASAAKKPSTGARRSVRIKAKR